MEPKRNRKEPSRLGTQDRAVLTCQGMAGLGEQWEGYTGGRGGGRCWERECSQHPFPELQEALKTEQETAIIRFAF